MLHKLLCFIGLHKWFCVGYHEQPLGWSYDYACRRCGTLSTIIDGKRFYYRSLH